MLTIAKSPSMAPPDGNRQCRHLDTLRYFDTIMRHQDSNRIKTLSRLN
jgi:hypothetical protein